MMKKLRTDGRRGVTSGAESWQNRAIGRSLLPPWEATCPENHALRAPGQSDGVTSVVSTQRRWRTVPEPHSLLKCRPTQGHEY